MRWRDPADQSRPVITARQHIESGHAAGGGISLPETCVIFEMGGALAQIEKKWPVRLIAQELPCFISSPRCISIEGRPDVCFVQGAYGAPAAADTLETVRALGAKRVLVIGMCGGFGKEIQVGDIVVPHRILCEEGASFHYYEQPRWARPDGEMHEKARAHFERIGKTTTDATVTCDAFFRQTFFKEQKWREEGCVGVDMEASALLNVAAYYGMPAAAVLLCSDRHPLNEGEPKWAWGGGDFREVRHAFIRNAVLLALAL